MAKFEINGFEEIEKQLLKEADGVEAVAGKMLIAGAEILVKAHSESILRNARGSRSRGTLAKSISRGEIVRGSSGMSIDVYPKGNQPHGNAKRGSKGKVSNAAVGFILENGRSNMPAIPWMATANKQSAEDVQNAMQEVWRNSDD